MATVVPRDTPHGTAGKPKERQQVTVGWHRWVEGSPTWLSPPLYRQDLSTDDLPVSPDRIAAASSAWWLNQSSLECVEELPLRRGCRRYGVQNVAGCPRALGQYACKLKPGRAASPNLARRVHCGFSGKSFLRIRHSTGRVLPVLVCLCRQRSLTTRVSIRASRRGSAT